MIKSLGNLMLILEHETGQGPTRTLIDCETKEMNPKLSLWLPICSVFHKVKMNAEIEYRDRTAVILSFAVVSRRCHVFTPL